MDKCTHEVRKQDCKNIINQCLQRSEGMTAKQWLDETAFVNRLTITGSKESGRKLMSLQPLQRILHV